MTGEASGLPDHLARITLSQEVAVLDHDASDVERWFRSQISTSRRSAATAPVDCPPSTRPNGESSARSEGSQ